jgi:hypothetical protein
MEILSDSAASAAVGKDRAILNTAAVEVSTNFSLLNHNNAQLKAQP